MSSNINCQAVIDDKMCKYFAKRDKLFCDIHKNRCERCRREDKEEILNYCVDCYYIIHFDTNIFYKRNM